MKQNILTVIEENMSGFSKGQKRIAGFILAHYERAAYMTAAKLGAAAGVSESTVVRFAFELGMDGYPALQNKLRELIKSKLTAVQRIAVANEQMGQENLLSKVLTMDIEKIRQTMEDISQESFNGAVDAIVGAETVYLLGARSASIPARFLSMYFNYMFPHVKLIDPSSESEMFEQLLRVGEADVMICISFPRYSKRTVKAMRFAKDRGACVIAITDNDASPLAEGADYLLKAQSDMAAFVDSLVAPMSLINALIVAVGQKKQETLTQTFAELEHIWDEYEVYQKTES